MSKMIYTVLCYDAADDQTCSLVAFSTEELANQWREEYVKQNYETDSAMNKEGVWVWVEATVFEK